jgi:hypothetical protein
MTNHYKWHEHFTMFTLKEIVLGADYHIMNSKGTYQDTIQEKLIKFTDYLLFKDGTIIVNPYYEDIDRFEELTEGAGGYFNPDFIKIIRSHGKFRKRKIKSDEYSVPPFEWNSKETLELFDLIENEKKEDNTYKNLGIESPYIKALQHLYFTFYQWHKKNRLPIDSDIKYHLLMKEKEKAKKEAEYEALNGGLSNNNNESSETSKVLENENPASTPPAELLYDIKKEEIRVTSEKITGRKKESKTEKTKRKKTKVIQKPKKKTEKTVETRNLRTPFIWSGDKSKLEKLLINLIDSKIISSVRKINETFEPVTISIDLFMNTHFSYPSKPENCEVDNNHFIKWERPQDEVGYFFNILLSNAKLIFLDKIYLNIESHFISKENNHLDNGRLCSAYTSTYGPILKIKESSVLKNKLKVKKDWMEKLEKIVNEL